MTMHRDPVSLFLSYAHEDEPLLKMLESHLSLLKRLGILSTWHDRLVMPGSDWAKELDMRLNQALVILLLVSADFLASDYCYGVEIQRALARQRAGEALVVPILLRSVDWSGAPFAHLQVLPTDARPVTSWADQDAAFTDIARGLRKLIEEAPTLSPGKSSATFPRFWNVPYPPNRLFTGRDKPLTDLEAVLQSGQPTAVSQPQAITGLGGIGKTQLALEYAYRHRGEYQAVLWALADTRENLTTSYLALAKLFNLPEQNEQESERIIAAVKQWLQQNGSWLLILDNADDLALARDFLPPVFGGHVLLTTRAQAPGRFARRLEVDVFSTEVGTLFLLCRAGVLALEASLDQATQADRDAARAICEELGGLPLALDQAGAYIEETRCGLLGYQQLYQQRRAYLLTERRGQLVDDYPHPVAATWSLSFQQVEQRDPAAADLLRLCSFLAPDAIPQTILTEGARHLGPYLAPVAADSYLLNRAIETLLTYSLLRRDARSGSEAFLSVHRLVQAVLVDQMNEREREQWSQRVIQAVDAACPPVEYAVWPQWERLLPHALTCIELIKQEQIATPEATQLLNATGRNLQERRQYVEAEPIYRQAYEVSKKVYDDHDLALSMAATSLNNIAQVSIHLGKIETALLYGKMSYKIQKDLLVSGKGGEENVGSILETLGQIYLKINDIATANKYFREAFDIHARTSNKKGELAVSNYFGQISIVEGKLEEAMRWLTRSEYIGNEIYTEDYIKNINLRGRICMKQWKLEDAQLFFEQAITIARQIHKYQYALNMFDLAVVFIMRNQQQQFNQCWQEAREISLQWKYFDLLGQAEKMLGNVDYMSCNYQLAFAHYREYSHWAALQSDKIEFERALRFVLDQMFDVPDELISAILDDFIVYWIAQNWEEYPMAKTLLQEMKKLLDK